MSYNKPDFKPFSSGCGMCKPSTDYYSQTQTGGGNYSEDGLIPQSNGKNFYKPVDYSMPLNNKFIKNNFGIDYATANGGVKNKTNKINKNKSKKLMKGGLDIDATDDIKGLSTVDYALFSSGGSKNKKKSLKGGSNHMMTKHGQEMHHIPGEEMHEIHEMHKMHKMHSQSGGKKSLAKATSLKGGFNHMMTKHGQEMYHIPGEEMHEMHKMHKMHSQSCGKKSLAKATSLKGGSNHMMTKHGQEMHHIPGEEMHEMHKMHNRHSQSGGKKSVKKNTPSKSMKGGMESSGATSLPTRFYKPDTPLDNYPELSGNGSMSAYGPIESGDIGTGMLAPYTASTCQSANPSSGMKTGGSKKNKKSMKGCSNHMHVFSDKEYAEYDAVGGKKNVSKKNKKSMRGGMESNDMSGFSDKEYAEYDAVGGKKNVSKKNKKSMRGGMESSGATSLPTRFYKPETPLDNYPELSGNGSMSAYGPIESGDIGTGMLAPYTASTCQSANPSSGMKTGGSKKNKKSLRGGGGLIPSIPDTPVTTVQNGVNGAIDKFSSFMAKLDANYLKSVEYVKSIKIGNQRLIQGGSKGKKSSKTDKKEKKIIKKPMTKKPMTKKKGGSNGSDFALTLNSRGPVNAPDDYWEVPGEKWFRQFNKTGDYIPNSKLPYAATPLLAGTNESCVVSGYDESMLAYQSV